MKKRKVLVPEYMNEFKCIGAQCEDNCCIGWNVAIDKETNMKYKNVRNQELKEKLQKYISRNRSNGTNENYAKIKMLDNDCCPFLNEKKFCSIQEVLDEKYLSNVCSTYPRSVNVVNGSFERSATLSCPEIARLALLKEEGINFFEIEENSNIRNIIEYNFNFQEFKFKNKSEKYFWKLRTFTIQVLKARDYTIDERLIILGMFYQKIQELYKENEVENVLALIEDYTKLIVTGEFKDILENMPSSDAMQMELLKELCDIKILAGNRSKKYFNCYSEFLTGILYTRESTIEKISLRYSEGCKKYYMPYMKEHEYILENYLVDYVFKKLFPLGQYNNMFDNYVMFIVHYAMIKMHLIGIASLYKEKFNTDKVIEVVQAFTKAIDHNKEFLKHVFNLLKGNGYGTMAHMTILIKN
ncbi:flagellin lysine-N-methylase [Clostridium drakei]|uniref:Lysine-N-methylase n=1 Tax=Clostridium drakei TaxID=332101 RepID=A0A2U8DN93_9CLOT|nr:flagellin lysine-N-methylase [Clostridium drakei]AWI03674.1 lysine-N-methylase [Clostridium drakei]